MTNKNHLRFVVRMDYVGIIMVICRVVLSNVFVKPCRPRCYMIYRVLKGGGVQGEGVTGEP